MKKNIAYSLSWKEAEEILQKILKNNRIQLDRVDFEYYEASDEKNTLRETTINKHIAEYLKSGSLAGYAHENGILFIEQ